MSMSMSSFSSNIWNDPSSLIFPPIDDKAITSFQEYAPEMTREQIKDLLVKNRDRDMKEAAARQDILEKRKQQEAFEKAQLAVKEENERQQREIEELKQKVADAQQREANKILTIDDFDINNVISLPKALTPVNHLPAGNPGIITGDEMADDPEISEQQSNFAIPVFFSSLSVSNLFANSNFLADTIQMPSTLAEGINGSQTKNVFEKAQPDIHPIDSIRNLMAIKAAEAKFDELIFGLSSSTAIALAIGAFLFLSKKSPIGYHMF